MAKILSFTVAVTDQCGGCGGPCGGEFSECFTCGHKSCGRKVGCEVCRCDRMALEIVQRAEGMRQTCE